MQTKNIVIVVGIIVGALILGVLTGHILKQQRDSTNEEPPIEEPSPTPPAPPSSLLEGLPPPPGEDATEEEEIAFAEAIRQQAMETETIEVSSSCAVSPMIAKVGLGVSLTFTNKDSIEHNVTTFVDKVLVLSPQDSSTIETPTSGGIYGVACDGNEKAFIVVNPS